MRRVLFLICALLLVSLPVLAQQATLLGPDLAPRAVVLQSLSPEAIVLTDAQGGEMELTPQEVLRLRFAAAARPVSDDGQAVVTLRDGQVLVGELVRSNDEEALRLKLDENRAAQVSLDQMRSLSLDRAAVIPNVEDDDALLLATGEVLTGFVETIDRDSVGFVIGDADDAIQIPMQRIKAMALANKPTLGDREPGMVRVKLLDGSVLLLKAASLLPGEGVLTGVSTLPILPSRLADEGVSTDAAARLSLPMKTVYTIEPISARHTLSGLTRHGLALVEGGEVFGVPMPPRVETDGSIALHAPTTLGFDLPKGASRLTLTAAMNLGEGTPESRRALAGCELVIYQGDQRLGGCTLTHDGPPQRLNLALNGGPLRIALEPGVNGPVLDRVLITDAELLVSE